MPERRPGVPPSSDDVIGKFFLWISYWVSLEPAALLVRFQFAESSDELSQTPTHPYALLPSLLSNCHAAVPCVDGI